MTFLGLNRLLAFNWSLVHVNIRWCVEQITLICPYRVEFILNLFSPLLQLVYLLKALTQILHLLLDLHLLALCPDALKLPGVTIVTGAELQIVIVVLFERSPR